MIGQTVSHYKIIEKLGEGGMGVVYKAEDTRLKRTVALKFLPPELTGDKDTKARFVHEAQAASALDHPNICTIHEIDETEDGRMFICMACYEGETLKELVSRSPLELGKAIVLTKRVAAGLAQAHGQGIIHRDLKPANIFVTRDDQVKVVDFGLAKLVGRTKLTKTGKTTGTVAYMSPEQARGEEVDQRTDIWSLGVTLYEMVTGQVPFKSDYDEAVVYSILNESADPVTGRRTGVPMELERIITKCLEKDPGERYQTTADLIADLRHLQKTMGAQTDTVVRDTDSSQKARSPWRWAWLIGLVIIFASVAGIVSRFRAPPDTPSVSEKKMLVVLPFENMGSPDDDYFASGITEEITSRLASIKTLGVISRKSAVHYAGTDKTTRQIGDELGVQYVLEGTIRWARHDDEPNRVRVIPELVRIADDTRLWSETYDRVITDVFEIQSDIANKVGEQLGLTLFEDKMSRSDVRPTDNLEAYHAYLRGNYYTGQPHFTVGDWKRAIDSYTRAAELDPGFALAYAKLSEAHARFYYYRVDLSEERRDLAKSALDRAVSLKPDMPGVHLAAGYYYLMVERDVDRAFAEFAMAPENAEVLEAKGDGYRQQGKWLEAFDQYEKACRLSPRNSSPLVEIALTAWLYRRYPEAVEAADEAVSIAPNLDWPYLAKGVIFWCWQGASEEARKAFESVSPDHDWAPWVWYWQMVYEGNYREALDYLSSIPGDWIRIKIDAKPRVLYEAFVHDALNQPELATAAYESAKILLEAEVDAYPEDPRYHSSLGIAYAALGQAEDAIREGKRAVELLPISKDAVYGIPYVMDLALIYTVLGENEKALAGIEELLSSPGMLSVPLLKVDPRWNRLRDNPRFQAILEKYSK
jgi:serine/threonine protein kinase/tetratricopeptide (TPR) repeat protein